MCNGSSEEDLVCRHDACCFDVLEKKRFLDGHVRLDVISEVGTAEFLGL
jgi:hypothetical protein